MAASAGSVTYVILYLIKSYITMTIEGQAQGAIVTQLYTKGITSLANAVMAVIASVLLAQALRPALARAGILPQKKSETKEIKQNKKRRALEIHFQGPPFFYSVKQSSHKSRKNRHCH